MIWIPPPGGPAVGHAYPTRRMGGKGRFGTVQNFMFRTRASSARLPPRAAQVAELAPRDASIGPPAVAAAAQPAEKA